MRSITEGSYAMASLGSAAADSIHQSESGHSGSPSSSGGWAPPAAAREHRGEDQNGRQYLPPLACGGRLAYPQRPRLANGVGLPLSPAPSGALGGGAGASGGVRGRMVPRTLIMCSESAPDLPPGGGIATMAAQFFCEVGAQDLPPPPQPRVCQPATRPTLYVP